MKSKLAFATLLLALITANSYAQQSMEWGLKAGGNYFKVGGRSFDNTYNVSFSGGAYAELNYNSHFTLQPELLFNMAQAKTSDAFNQIYSNYGAVSGQLVSLDYIAVPILIAYKPIPELSILFGPQYGFLISQTTGLTAARSANTFSRSDFALVFGGQLNVSKFKLGLRFQEGLNNINAINTTDTWRTYGLQFYVGFQIKDRKLK
ncbi:MAG TPA: porin family protein [Puia sp.]|jgi:hypothetical protein|nr:porin family protein [Puia sp.]